MKRLREQNYLFRGVGMLVVAALLMSGALVRASEGGTAELQAIINANMSGDKLQVNDFCTAVASYAATPSDNPISSWSKHNRLIPYALCGKQWKNSNKPLYDAVQLGANLSGDKITGTTLSHKAAMSVLKEGEAGCKKAALLGGQLKSLGEVAKNAVCATCRTYFQNNNHPKALTATCGSSVPGAVIAETPVLVAPSAQEQQPEAVKPTKKKKTRTTGSSGNNDYCWAEYSRRTYAQCKIDRYGQPFPREGYAQRCVDLYQRCNGNSYMEQLGALDTKVAAANAQLARYGQAARLVQ